MQALFEDYVSGSPPLPAQLVKLQARLERIWNKATAYDASPGCQQQAKSYWKQYEALERQERALLAEVKAIGRG